MFSFAGDGVRHPEVPWLTLAPTVQALLNQGEVTRGLTARTRGQHVIVSRLDEIGPDPRFRLTPLGAGQYGLSLYERNRWQPLPYDGGLQELVAVMNTDLAAWAAGRPTLKAPEAGPPHPMDHRPSSLRQ